MPAAQHSPSPELPVGEIATIFSKAILRLRSHRGLPAANTLNLSDPYVNCLEFPATKPLTVPRG